MVNYVQTVCNFEAIRISYPMLHSYLVSYSNDSIFYTCCYPVRLSNPSEGDGEDLGVLLARCSTLLRCFRWGEYTDTGPRCSPDALDLCA